MGGVKKASAKGMTAAVVGVSIGLVVALVILPVALNEAAGAEAANWGAAGVTILGLFGVIAAAGLIYFILNAFDIL